MGAWRASASLSWELVNPQLGVGLALRPPALCTLTTSHSRSSGPSSAQAKQIAPQPLTPQLQLPLPVPPGQAVRLCGDATQTRCGSPPRACVGLTLSPGPLALTISSESSSRGRFPFSTQPVPVGAGRKWARLWPRLVADLNVPRPGAKGLRASSAAIKAQLPRGWDLPGPRGLPSAAQLPAPARGPGQLRGRAPPEPAVGSQDSQKAGTDRWSPGEGSRLSQPFLGVGEIPEVPRRSGAARIRVKPPSP